MTIDAYGEYGPGRDFSLDPPIIWDGHAEIPPGWTCRLRLEETAENGSKRLKQPEPDPNVTAEWLKAQRASAEAMKRAQARARSVRNGRSATRPHEFSNLLVRSGLVDPAPAPKAKPKLTGAERLLPERLREDA